MNTIIEQLRKAHDEACKVFNILSDITGQLRESENGFSDDIEEQIEELTEIADELQGALYDLLEENGKN